MPLLNGDTIVPKSKSISYIEPSNDGEDDTNNTSTIASSTCPICDESPSQNAIAANEKYPILCSTAECEYNMCSSCISQMLSSSQEELRIQASDGNDFSLELNCPNCRGKFSILLEDVLMLRRAEIWRLELCDQKDMELSASELREKYFWDETQLSELALAESRYNKDSSAVLEPTQDSFSHETMKELDAMMLAGLENTMSEAEQKYLASFMTSGCPNKLAQGAELLASITVVRTTKIRTSLPETQTFDGPINRRDPMHRPSTANNNLSHPAKLTRTKSAIESSRYNRGPRTTPTSSPHISPSSRVPPRQGGKPVGFAAGISASTLTARNPPRKVSVSGDTIQWKRLYPLPVRMPHAYTITLNFDPYAKWGCNLSFLDDEESLADFHKHDEVSNKKEKLVKDAFQRLSVGMWMNTTWKEPIAVHHMQAVNNLLTGPGTSMRTSCLVVPSRRVVVSSVKGSLRKTGLQVGDVITHVNGEPFGGNSKKLRCIIDDMRNVKGLDQNRYGIIYPKMQIVVNAEISTAEVLRLRSNAAEAALKHMRPS